jgi:glycerol-3-phosphate dehydrogenase (NAD(P)+)
MAVITVVGAGMMGSALCVPLVDAGHEVRLVGTPLDREIVAVLRATGEHPKLKHALPREIRPFQVEELGAAMDGAEVLGLGVSSAGVRWAAEAVGPFVREDLPILMITKGLALEGGELRVLPDVLASLLPAAVRERIHPVAVAGPCIAGELARRVPTGVVFAGRDRSALDRLAPLARTPYYHVWTSTDVVGAETCAALKNAYAMGMAFAAGIHEARGGKEGSLAMHNYESAVFAEAVMEMRRVVEMLGGDPDSASGLPGVGDLDVTCNGGRTGRFGRLLGQGLSPDEAIRRMEGATLECLEILRVMMDALPRYEAKGALGADELPLLRHMAEVALDGRPIDMPFTKFFRRRP